MSDILRQRNKKLKIQKKKRTTETDFRGRV